MLAAWKHPGACPATGTQYGTAASLEPAALARLWHGLAPAQQEAIGTAVLRQVLADLIADDDGLVTTEAERLAACGPAQDGCQEIFDTVQAAFPQVLWYYPEGYTYEARDRHGNLLGEVEHASGDTYRFRPASPRLRLGRPSNGQPLDCLPPRVRKAVNDGGCFRAVLPDGRHYPDNLQPLA